MITYDKVGQTNKAGQKRSEIAPKEMITPKIPIKKDSMIEESLQKNPNLGDQKENLEKKVHMWDAFVLLPAQNIQENKET